MIKKNCLTFIFVFISLITISQNKVCESKENEFTDLNTIGKCAIEDFKKSKSKEFVKISSRNRYIRKKPNLKKNLSVKAIVDSSNKINVNVIKVIAYGKAESKKSLIEEAPSKGYINNFIRFDLVNEAPIFIDCAGYSSNIKQNCMKETVANNILDNFIYPFDAASEGLEGRVWVRFIIDKDGYIKNITTNGPEKGELLEEEAKRLVLLLPKFIPGKHNNEYVNVEYFMPIDFQLDE